MSRTARIRRSSRRGGPVLVVALGALLVASAALAAARRDPGRDGPTGGRAPAAAAPSLARAVGRKIMTGFAGTTPSRGLLARARRGQIGGGILFGPNVSGHLRAASAAPQRAAPAGGNAPLVITVDQEGGGGRRP